MDILSKFAFAIPLKLKEGKEVERAFLHIFKTTKPVPKLIQVDQGTKFYKEHVNNSFKKFNIKMY